MEQHRGEVSKKNRGCLSLELWEHGRNVEWREERGERKEEGGGKSERERERGTNRGTKKKKKKNQGANGWE